MKTLKSIIAKIEKIEKLLNELKDDLNQTISTLKFDVNEPTLDKKRDKRIDTKSLIVEFDDLYQEYISRNDRDIIDEFLNKKDVAFLKDFCRANNITLDSKKMSKQKIGDEIMKWFSQRKAITKRLDVNR